MVDSTNGNGLGIRQLKGQGVQNVFMHTSATAGKGPNGYLNPNPLAGYALIQLAYNYNRYCGGFDGFISPVTGSALNIDATDAALTAHTPYVITSVGHAAAGTVTIAPVADVSGSLASTWFRLYDAYGNTFIIWFSVAGVGAAPVGVSGTLVQQSIALGATAAQVGTALATTIGALLAAQPGNITAPAGVNSFTASGSTTVTVVNTNTAPYELPGAPADGLIPTGFTFAQTVKDSNRTDWMGVGVPPGVVPAVGVSFVATSTGSGSSTGQVHAAGISGITSIEVIGDPNLSFGPVPFRGSPNTGGWVLIQFLAPTNSSTTTLIPTAPAAGSVVGLGFYVEQASILVAGE